MYKHFLPVVAGLGLLAGLGAAPTSAQAATGQITGIGNMCVDVAGASSANGTPLQLHYCTGNAAQQWDVRADGTIRALGKCMDVRAGGTDSGTPVQLYDCNGTGAQRWSVNSAHDIVNVAANKCLDAAGRSSADGTKLQIWTCTGNSNQKWNAPSASGGGGDNGGSGDMAVAPYIYNGWGNPPSATNIMSSTDVKWFTMAFILSNGYCNPQWDGQRGLTGGVDQSTINMVRQKGGGIIPSFGGYSGNKLNESCSSAGELANAYQKVINTYGFKAIDIDIEASAYNSGTVQQRTIDALKTIQANNPGIIVYVTIGTGQNGPDTGMINRAARSGFRPTAWTIMPFDFGGQGQNMADLTKRAAGGLHNALKNAYGYGDSEAYRHMGISSMNGKTDVGETVTLNDFRSILGYAQSHHLARLTFWSTNRDRPCPSGYSNNDTCSGVSQGNWDFTRIFAQYGG